jgi:hypothetical protein
MIRSLIKYCVPMWVILALLVYGCAGGKLITKSCDWLDAYVPKAQNAMTRIQTDYNTYAAIATGAIPAAAPIIAAAKAWLGTADFALNIFGMVQSKVCDQLTPAVIEQSLTATQVSLPELAIPKAKLMQLKVLKK